MEKKFRSRRGKRKEDTGEMETGAISREITETGPHRCMGGHRFYVKKKKQPLEIDRKEGRDACDVAVGLNADVLGILW